MEYLMNCHTCGYWIVSEDDVGICTERKYGNTYPVIAGKWLCSNWKSVDVNQESKRISPVELGSSS